MIIWDSPYRLMLTGTACKWWWHQAMLGAFQPSLLPARAHQVRGTHHFSLRHSQFSRQLGDKPN